MSRAVATILAVLALALGLWTCATPDARLFRTGSEADLDRADRLYRRHCAFCHGQTGTAETETAEILFPRPRTFSRGTFLLASTANGIPTDADLVRTMKRGMPGSPMTSFAWMGDADLELLAVKVRELAVEGLIAEVLRRADAVGVPRNETDARAFAERRMTPGEVLDPGLPADAGPDALARGRQTYLVHCAACHGEDGTGREPDPLWAGMEDMHWPRNFTAGILRGGASHRDIFWRVAAGMPGALMPPTRLPQSEMADLVAYVRSLVPPAEPDRLTQPRREIPVPRVAQLPTAPDDPVWDRTPRVRLALAPLWWWKGAVQEVDLSGLHDGSALVLRASWADATGNERAIDGSRFPDGFAVQFCDELDPPLFAMGSRGQPVTIWHWKAFRPRDVAGILDLMEATARTDVPPYRPAPGAVGPAHVAEAVQARGSGSVPEWSTGTQIVQAVPVWESGRWSVLLKRSLLTREAGSVSLTPGRVVYVACAVWEGGGGDHGSRKSITPWHRMLILP